MVHYIFRANLLTSSPNRIVRGFPQHGLQPVSMKHKYGKWFADWRDEHGKRHAKAFRTKSKARAYSKRMQREAQAKKARPHKPLRKRRMRGSKPISTVPQPA